ALVPPTATVVGLTKQVESAGVPEHWSETLPANPPAGAIATAKLADCPADTLAEAGAAERVKSMPVPLNGTECGVPGALSAIIRLAERVPPPVGVNIKLIVQFPPAGTMLPPPSLYTQRRPPSLGRRKRTTWPNGFAPSDFRSQS